MVDARRGLPVLNTDAMPRGTRVETITGVDRGLVWQCSNDLRYLGGTLQQRWFAYVMDPVTRVVARTLEEWRDVPVVRSDGV
jgi:hypothetical protein